MAWVGKGSVSYKFGGAPSFIRLGAYAVPREMTFKFTGADLDPDMRAVLQVRDGRPQCVSLAITAKDGGRPVRTSDMEAFARVDTMVAALFTRESHLAVERDGVTQLTPILDEREFWRAMNEVEGAVKAARRGSSRAELERVASIYAEHADRDPVAQVQALMGYGSSRTAARRVKEAEEEGLLSRTTPGKRRKAVQPEGDA